MKSLFSRLWLSASLAVLLLLFCFWQWQKFNHEYTTQRVQQSLHKELAEHMAHINPLLSQGVTSDAALKEAFHDFMLLGPSFEIYTLDTQGNVIAYDAKEEKIKTPRVDVQFIERFLSGGDLPLVGTDPRGDNQKKIFSATRLLSPTGEHTGYLYVIIGGEIFDSWHTSITEAQAPTNWFVGIIFSAIAALVIFTLLLRYFTSPVRRLAKDVTQVAKQDLNQGLVLPGDYRNSQEIDVLSQHINQLLAEISRQHQEAAAQQKAKHEFLLHLSHDLKTPLTSLLGYIDTWLLLPEEEREAELIEIAANSGRHLQQLLAQLLELAALENGQVTPKATDVSVVELLGDLKQTFAPRAKVQNVELDFTQEQDLQIETDPQLMHRILNNLVDNAIRYTPSGGKISIKLQRHDEHYWLNVSDNGSGMHKHELQALKQLTGKPISFQPKAILPQLGVGLAIVRQLLALLKCQIEIDSSPGKGSSFKIQLS